ncbi:MAG TPA: cobalt-precorrin-7 (C(5))-methyltransferase [Methanoregulaceae archaeon]|nr:cobalt-precorrin-7 (C(5))-methyltransferase [Methanoregulaceae archaeon]HPD75232.1 cobalt-precorrin-7 (C(5))-methyltransferase [Methanoregulaceae archaeon]HRY75117.1 cobalt-precorrin-7 (C(5))-methyltransferase [Methanoregulaceae archaeon]
MKIVGVGCGPGLLTEEAILVIRRARRVYGSSRALAIARPYFRKDCIAVAITDYTKLPSLPAKAVVLSTGDPMLAGLGYLPGDVVPGISSLQLAAARLKVPLERVVTITAHGSRHAEAMGRIPEELGRGHVVFLITDPKFDIAALYHCIRNLPESYTVGVCENIGYPDERITVGKGAELPYPSHALYSLMIGHF